jgi:hypothetical protein
MAEEKESVVATLTEIEAVLVRRVNIVARRSPESFLDEAEALDFIRLRRELRE